MFTLYIYIYIFFTLLSTLSLKSVHKRLIKMGRNDDAKKLAEKVVEDLASNIFSACKINLTVTGKELSVQSDKPKIYIGNHQSAFDIVILIKALGVKPFMAKSELAKIPILRYWIKAIGCVFVERNSPSAAAESFRQAKNLIDNGSDLIIFPEGTRSHTEEILPFKDGAFHIAKYCKCDLVLFAINGSGKLYEQNGKKLNPSSKVSLNFIEQIKTENFERNSWKELPEKCHNIIENAKKHCF